MITCHIYGLKLVDGYESWLKKDVDEMFEGTVPEFV